MNETTTALIETPITAIKRFEATYQAAKTFTSADIASTDFNEVQLRVCLASSLRSAMWLRFTPRHVNLTLGMSTIR